MPCYIISAACVRANLDWHASNINSNTILAGTYPASECVPPNSSVDVNHAVVSADAVTCIVALSGASPAGSMNKLY